VESRVRCLAKRIGDPPRPTPNVSISPTLKKSGREDSVDAYSRSSCVIARMKRPLQSTLEPLARITISGALSLRQGCFTSTDCSIDDQSTVEPQRSSDASFHAPIIKETHDFLSKLEAACDDRKSVGRLQIDESMHRSMASPG
jgi:hypothetical protein